MARLWLAVLSSSAARSWLPRKNRNDHSIHDRRRLSAPDSPPRYASWQDAMKDAVRDPAELCRLLGLAGGIGRAAPKRRRDSFRCSCRAGSWPGCGRATRPTRCCGRCCRWPTRWPTCRASSPIRSTTRRPTRQPGLLQKYRRPRAARHDRHLRRPLPLLLPPPFSLRRDAALARRLAAGDSTRSRPTTVDPRSDPQRRRSADARRCDAGRARSTSWPRFRICGGCGFTRGCRS